MKPNTDQLDIEMVLAGNVNAFANIIARYKDFVYTVVIRMVKNREEAEEISQDTFIKAFQSLSNFKGESKFSTWLYTIAYRKALDSIKKSKRTISSETIDLVNEGNLGLIQNGLDYLEAKERREIIQNCVQQLPEGMAAAITFYYFEDLSTKEIATIMELSQDNVKIKLYRGRKKLFTLLEQYIKPETIYNNGQAI